MTTKQLSVFATAIMFAGVAFALPANDSAIDSDRHDLFKQGQFPTVPQLPEYPESNMDDGLETAGKGWIPYPCLPLGCFGVDQNEDEHQPENEAAGKMIIPSPCWILGC